jgi:PPOX class probable F420-dependent enzyme
MDTVSISSSVEEFLKKPNFLVLGTLRKDGSIQMTPVWFEYVDGVFRVSTTTERAKYKNIKRDNRVTFVIYDLENPYRYVQVQGEASITPDPKHELIDHLSQRYRGETPYGGDPEHKEDRVIVTITPKKIIPQRV